MSTGHKRPAACGAAAFAVAMVLASLAAPPAMAIPSPAAAHASASLQLSAASNELAAPLAKKPNPPRDPSQTNVMVNKQYPLVPKKYVPRLTSVPGTGIRLQPTAAKAYKKLVAAARKDGVSIKLVSGYRSYAVQERLLDQYTRAYGSAYATRIAAAPGTSEHQTGLAIDVGNHNPSCALQACFAKTKVGSWMAKNATTYGFILRYPRGMENVTGYNYEPWHFRYLGTTQAKAVSRTKAKTLEHFYGVASSPKATTTKGSKLTTANLNMRRSPSLGAGIVKTVPKGSRVQLTGKKSGSWVQTSHKGSTGWMSSQYLR
jgi:D-alanyl-D-alanine carboxypeptidase